MSAPKIAFPKREIQKWVDALRSGEYQQTRGVLESATGFCCLGVACKVLIPEAKQYWGMGGRLMGSFPGAQEWAPNWLRKIPGDFRQRFGFGLDGLNDVGFVVDSELTLEPFTFDEIADLLQAVYIEGVLDDQPGARP